MNNLKKPVKIKSPSGKLGVLLPGMGAVATTFIAGVLGIKRGLGLPIGSLTQMATIRIGKRSLSNFPKISDYVPLVKLDQLEFGGWDIFDDSCYKAALKAGVLEQTMLSQLKVEIDALVELAGELGVPVSGKDFKTGQTLMKTILAPGLKARMLGLEGWYSTNILGNRDGEVLDDSESFKTKEVSKLSVLETILQKDQYPDLYENICHKVSINYYPPRGDNKEGWDNIDLFGWMGYPMQIKVIFLCRDSILAAPIVLDLALFSDLAKRAGEKGIQEWLSFYYKSPMCARVNFPEHDLFIQQMKLKNTLRFMMGDEEITHHKH